MTQPKPPKPFYTTKEVAEFLGVTAPTIIKWVEQGRVGASKPAGGHRRIPRDELVRLAHECGRPFDVTNEEPSSAEIRILVIDHEEDFAEMVAEFLALQAGMEAMCTVELVDVGIQLERFRPNVVLCAIDLPPSSLQRIAQMVKSLKARFLLLTNGRTRHQTSLCADLGGDLVVEKPVKLDDLLQIIRPA